ncbi:DNA-binding PadR family transcriptional regulator [Paenibacillus forsythiae]|uniref:DNA-binding PadR family transcriptional regulator n=1 Tax=Paenibacillus forsythiae TaxID=365616 RepID=A0ABU3H901_9BACL|nr:DNA-binding PadR family transcriptional regulator [Paenibacillus forsythiae]
MVNTKSNALSETTYYILLATIHPLHGYGIIKFINELTKGKVKLGPGTLYGALSIFVGKEVDLYI